MTLKAFWAPQTELAQDEPTLEQVLGCFARKTVVTGKAPVKPAGGHVTRVGFRDEPATNANATAVATADAKSAPVQKLYPQRTRFFTVSLPAGWKISTENDHGVDVGSPDGTLYVGFSFVINQVNMGSPGQQIAGFLQKWYPGVQVTQWRQPPGGQGWQIVEGEFVGTTHRTAMHGVSRVQHSRAVDITMMWTVTPQARWDALHPTLEAIAASFQIQPNAIAAVQGDVRRQMASYPKPVPTHIPVPASSSPPASGMGSYQEDQDNLHTAWSDATRGQDRAVSPSTGEEYVVPTNAWRTDGAQGAGYYRQVPGGGEERLNVENVIQGTTE
jgi:hypothetical protein